MEAILDKNIEAALEPWRASMFERIMWEQNKGSFCEMGAFTERTSGISKLFLVFSSQFGVSLESLESLESVEDVPLQKGKTPFPKTSLGPDAELCISACLSELFNPAGKEFLFRDPGSMFATQNLP